MDVVPFSAYFPYIHPSDADALARTCRYFQEAVDEEYKRSGREAVLPGGCWHRHLCKRARDSIHVSHANFMPQALSSLLEGKCIVCGKRYLARVSVWGFCAHAPCIRGHLVNTFLIPGKFGLASKDWQTLPREELTGYNSADWEKYTYDVVFRHPCRRMVPREWTLKYLVTRIHAPKVESFLLGKRKAREAVLTRENSRQQKRMALARKRSEALATRRAALDNHPRASMVYRTSQIMGERMIMGDYLDEVVVCTTTLRKVVMAAETYDPLLQVLHPQDIVSTRYDALTQVRMAVNRRLGEMVSHVVSVQKSQWDRQADAALVQRRQALDAHPRGGLVHAMRLKVGKCVVGDYLDRVVACTTTLPKVVMAAEKVQALLQVLHPCEIVSVNVDADTLVRWQVRASMAEMLVQISGNRPPRTRGTMCTSCNRRVGARECAYAQCGNCCWGCPRHRRR